MDYCQIPRNFGPLDFICSATDVPIRSGSLDTILCTEVLMHIDDPQRSFSEFSRLLAPGGRLWLSCAFCFEEMQKPHDYFRFTKYGVATLASRAGFSDVKIEPLGGYCNLLQYQLGTAALCLPIRPSAYGGGIGGWLAAAMVVGLKPLFAAACQLFTWAELRPKLPFQVDGLCIDYTVVAQKPSA